MPRTRSHIVIALVLLVYSISQLLQVPNELFGEDTVPELAAWHAASGLSGSLVTFATWRGIRWAWISALTWGAITAGLVLSLPRLLGLDEQAAAGMPYSAAVIAALAAAIAWYLHRSLGRER